MQEKDREKVALFRYGLIAPILNGQVANQKEYLAEVGGKVHQVPYYGPKEFTPKTLAGWLLAYRRAGFEGLKPKQRSDRGQSRKLTREQEEHLLALRRELRDMPVSVFYDRLVPPVLAVAGEGLSQEDSYFTGNESSGYVLVPGQPGADGGRSGFLRPSVLKTRETQGEA